MNTFLLLTLWTASLTGWGTVLYMYACGIKSVNPNYVYVIRALIAAIISLALGTICNSLCQAVLAAYR